MLTGKAATIIIALRHDTDRWTVLCTHGSDIHNSTD